MAATQVVLLCACASSSADATELVSKAPGPKGERADRDVDEIAISGNGRYVVFSSKARNLVPGNEGPRQIFRYDTRERRLVIVSRQPGQGGEAGSANATNPVVSANGRFVAFSSKARNLGGGGGGRYLSRRIFVADMRRNRLGMIDGKGTADLLTSDMTSDGKRLVITTNGGDLGGPTRNGNGNVYVVSRQGRNPTLVSRQSAADGGEGAELRASHGTISDDGDLVAFHTLAYNLGGDLADPLNVYLYDLDSKRVEQVSRTRSGKGANGYSIDPDISADGRYVAYMSYATNLSPRARWANVYRYEVATGRTELVSVAGRGAPRGGGVSPSISENGRFVAYEGDRDILIRDMRRRRTEVIRAPERFAEFPALSLDARAVAFLGQDRPVDDVRYQAYFDR